MKKSLFYNEGGSDKVYHIQVVPKENGYVVNFQYGRRGAALQEGTKTATPVSKDEAEKIFIKLANEKIRKGYKDMEESDHEPSEMFAKSVDVVFAPQLLNEIEDPQVYIDDDNYVMQEKKDGERRPVISSAMIKADEITNGWGLLEYDESTKLIECIKESDLFTDRYYASELYLMQSVIRRLAGTKKVLDFRNVKK